MAFWDVKTKKPAFKSESPHQFVLFAVDYSLETITLQIRHH